MSEEVRDHWYWRPGWRPGRSFYTWHLTVADQPGMTELLASYQPMIDQLTGLTSVPRRWLHFTLQGVGFTDRVERHELDAIAEATRLRCAELSPFTVTVGPAVIDTESLQLPVRPVEPLRQLRNTIRAAIADVWGEDSVPEHPELHPHISLGYWNTSGPAARHREVLAAYPERTASFPITQLNLITLTRQQQLYRWTALTTTQLGPDAPRRPALDPDT